MKVLFCCQPCFYRNVIKRIDQENGTKLGKFKRFLNFGTQQGKKSGQSPGYCMQLCPLIPKVPLFYFQKMGKDTKLFPDPGNVLFGVH